MPNPKELHASYTQLSRGTTCLLYSKQPRQYTVDHMLTLHSQTMEMRGCIVVYICTSRVIDQ